MTEKTKVLILGTYHFSDRGKHVIENEYLDVNSKQQEIMDLITSIAKFRPTKIAIESRREQEEKINMAYLNYCNNIKDNNINEDDEIVQVAYRLAKMLNHSKVYPLDVPVGLNVEDMFTYAKDNNVEVYNTLMEKIEISGTSMNETISNKSVIEAFRYFNSKEFYEEQHSDFYLYQTQIGAGDNYCGANVLIDWYKRNIYIFSNLLSIAKPGDRILVLYGAGHCKILRDFINSYNEFELVEALEYL